MAIIYAAVPLRTDSINGREKEPLDGIYKIKCYDSQLRHSQTEEREREKKNGWIRTECHPLSNVYVKWNFRIHQPFYWVFHLYTWLYGTRLRCGCVAVCTIHEMHNYDEKIVLKQQFLCSYMVSAVRRCALQLEFHCCIRDFIFVGSAVCIEQWAWAYYFNAIMCGATPTHRCMNRVERRGIYLILCSIQCDCGRCLLHTVHTLYSVHYIGGSELRTIFSYCVTLRTIHWTINHCK